MNKTSYNPLKTFPMCRVFYIWSMRAISEAALRSVAAVNVILKKRRGRFREGERAIVLNHLQNVLVMAAGLSRYFWPVRQQHEDRGLSLRIQFKVADDSPLRVR